MITSEELKKLRTDFTKGSLSHKDLIENPIQQLSKWMEEASQAMVNEVPATTVSTVSKSGQPSSRVVYIRKVETNGLVFFTNYDSKKGQDIIENPKACMNLFWPELERQIRIEGELEKVSNEVSDNYFHSRPKASKIGAWASHQSEKLESREVLESRIQKLNAQYTGDEVPRPENWGGYILKPNYFEFWQGRSSRLHDRFGYEFQDNGIWKIVRLNP